LIYVRSVIYIYDSEVTKTMKMLTDLLKTKSFLFIRGCSHERKIIQGTGLINKIPSDMIGFAQKANLSCVKYRRPYPPFITHNL
jgi:hypothetical protein